MEYCPCKNAYLPYQPFHSFGENIYWYPNLLAYTSISEIIYERLYKGKLINRHVVQSQLTEVYLSKLLSDFNVIQDENDKDFWDTKNTKAGDFDALAYKNGFLIHFELKQSSKLKNEFGERNFFKTKLIEKANEQIPRTQKYINIYKHQGRVWKI